MIGIMKITNPVLIIFNASEPVASPESQTGDSGHCEGQALFVLLDEDQPVAVSVNRAAVGGKFP